MNPARMIVTLALGLVAACAGANSKDQPPAAANGPAVTPATNSEAPAASFPGDSPVTLEATEWVLVDLDGQAVLSGENDRRPGFHLLADGHKVEGNAGCNRMMGTYQTDGRSLKFGPLASTKMACPAMETETTFLMALHATSRYEIAGSVLTLYRGDAPVARLEAAGLGQSR